MRRAIKRGRVRVDDISMAYLLCEAVDGNESPAVIFIHGFPFNKNMWRVQLEALPASVTGIAVDVRGHGSSTSGHGFFSVDVFARDLLAFMDTLRLEKIVLCGISMGGYIALRAYELAPSRFQGLVLCDTNAVADDNAGKLKRFETIQSVLRHGKRTFSIGFVKQVFSEKSIQDRPEAVELIKSSIRRNTERSICATLLALASRTDTTGSLKHIAVPALIIRGAEDKITTKEQTDVLENEIPDSRRVEISGSGHLPNLENPDAFNRELNRFLESR